MVADKDPKILQARPSVQEVEARKDRIRVKNSILHRHDTITAEQKHIAEEIWGQGDYKTPEEIRNILDVAEKLYKETLENQIEGPVLQVETLLVTNDTNLSLL